MEHCAMLTRPRAKASWICHIGSPVEDSWVTNCLFIVTASKQNSTSDVCWNRADWTPGFFCILLDFLDLPPPPLPPLRGIKKKKSETSHFFFFFFLFFFSWDDFDFFSSWSNKLARLIFKAIHWIIGFQGYCFYPPGEPVCTHPGLN